MNERAFDRIGPGARVGVNRDGSPLLSFVVPNNYQMPPYDEWMGGLYAGMWHDAHRDGVPPRGVELKLRRWRRSIYRYLEENHD